MATTFVCFATYHSALAAGTALDALRDSGILGLLDSANLSEELPGIAPGRVRLMIPEDQVAAAREVFRLHPWMNDGVGTGERCDNELTCLSCGAAMGDAVDSCPACGWTYAVPANPPDTAPSGPAQAGG